MSYGVLVIDAPKSCTKCLFTRPAYDRVECIFSHERIDFAGEDAVARKSSCPIHIEQSAADKLIDPKALYETIKENSYLLRSFPNSLDEGMFLFGIKQAIDEAPPIFRIPEDINEEEEDINHRR